LQQEASAAKHTHFMGVQQLEHSLFTSFNIDLGGQLVRNDLHTTLQAVEASCDLQGIYLLKEKQHVDNHTAINHAHAITYSNEYYKGILQDKSRAVFNGRVLVEPDAQKIDSNQKNDNLLLSADCEIDTKPELEIYADDVKCAHGATVGQLDEAAIFYLQARGITDIVARKMLTFGFAYEVAENIKQPLIHDVVKKALLNWFSSDETLQALLQ
jgi:Fe-S cluster assembly protein SufD